VAPTTQRSLPTPQGRDPRYDPWGATPSASDRGTSTPTEKQRLPPALTAWFNKEHIAIQQIYVKCRCAYGKSRKTWDGIAFEGLRKPSPKAFAESLRKPSKAIKSHREVTRDIPKTFGGFRNVSRNSRRLSTAFRNLRMFRMGRSVFRKPSRRLSPKASESHQKPSRISRDIPKTFGGFRNVSRNSRRLLNAFGGFQISRSTEVAPLRIQGWHTQISGLSCCWLPGSWLAPGWLLVGSWLAAG